MDCSHKCANLLCSLALLCLFILRGPPPMYLINISSEVIKTKENRSVPPIKSIFYKRKKGKCCMWAEQG